MYQTVIFDLDGTLLNTIDDLADSCNRTCQACGWPGHTVSEYLSMVGHGIPALIHAMLPQSARTPENETRALALFSADYAAHSLDSTAPYPGIPALLAHLKEKGVAIAVCSNKADEFTQDIVAHFFPFLFDHVQGKRPGVPTKPDPTVVHMILDRLHAKSSSTLYVGDSDTDMETGRNAGLDTCGVSWGFRSRSVLIDAGAKYLADSASELKQLILG